MKASTIGGPVAVRDCEGTSVSSASCFVRCVPAPIMINPIPT
jgi:hypothetical protein